MAAKPFVLKLMSRVTAAHGPLQAERAVELTAVKRYIQARGHRSASSTHVVPPHHSTRASNRASLGSAFSTPSDQAWHLSGQSRLGFCVRAATSDAATAQTATEGGQEVAPEDPWKVKMLYDGDCPLCLREVRGKR